MTEIFRFQVWLIGLNPTQGSEINKTRPCVIISPDEMMALRTVQVAPMTTKGTPYPFRIACNFKGKDGLMLLDQIRTVDKQRLIKKLGIITTDAQRKLCDCLQEMFAF